MLNRITAMGRITRDIELRTTPSGVSVLNFTIAVDRDFGNRDEKQTDFIDVVAWRSTAEFLAKYAGKGRLVCVDGSLQSRKWQDKDGGNRTSWEVVANSVYLCDRRPDGNSTGNAGFAAVTGAAQAAGVPVYNAAPEPAAYSPSSFSPSVDADDDVPF